MPAAKLVGADAERLDRPVHRFLAEDAANRHAVAKPDDPRKGVEDGEAALARARNQKPAIIGAEVERAIDVTMMSPSGDWRFSASRPFKPWARYTGDLLRHTTPVLSCTAGGYRRLTWVQLNLNKGFGATVAPKACQGRWRCLG